MLIGKQGKLHIFVSFASSEATRVAPLVTGFRERGRSVFWSFDIPAGTTDYHDVIRANLDDACVVVVVWTNISASSDPVCRECAQAERDKKLIQVLLDPLEPMALPFEVRFRAQKAELFNWAGDRNHLGWLRLNQDIDDRIQTWRSIITEESPDEQDLTYILGIDRRIAAVLYSQGVRRFDQIAKWSCFDIDRVNAVLQNRGRIEKEGWIEQARILASGEITEFARRRNCE